MKIQSVDSVIDQLILFFSKLKNTTPDKKADFLKFDSLRQLQLCRIFIEAFKYEEEFVIPPDVLIKFNEAKLSASLETIKPAKIVKAKKFKGPTIEPVKKKPKRLKKKQAYNSKLLITFDTVSACSLFMRLISYKKKHVLAVAKELDSSINVNTKTTLNEFCLSVVASASCLEDLDLLHSKVSKLLEIKHTPNIN